VISTGTGSRGYNDVAVNQAGDIFASLPGTGVVKVTPDGTRSVYSSAPVFGLAIDPSGNLYGSAGSTILKILPNGSTQQIYDGLNQPFGITTDSAGNIYAGSNGMNGLNNSVIRITPSGSATTYATGFGTVVSLAFGSGGKLFVGQAFGDNQLSVVEPNGTHAVLSTESLNPFGMAVRRGTSLGTVSSGSFTVTPGQQYNVTNASGGLINATAGMAQVGTLAGATLNTGASGATVATLTSGTINTAGGSVTTQGGTFTGQITGNGGLTKTGTGTLILNSANSFTGNTVINAGTVEIAVGDALGTGSAPIRIANNGKFKALQGVAVTKPVVISSTSAIYEHVLGASDSLANLAPISNAITTADIVAGDSAATTFTSNFNGNGSISLHGLNGTKFLMVLDMEGYIPEDATVADYYLGWWDETANSGTGGWVNAVAGNIGSNGSLAGAYTLGYQQFLTNNGGWNGTTMLGAYGLDLANQQVWAVIDHNSDFGVTNNGILVVPEPSSYLLAGLGIAGGWWRLRRRRRASANAAAA
jgi:autotransporter-associated beta strand protein